MSNYLDASPEAGKEFYQKFHDKGKVVMLNLLRFRTLADYTNLEELKPAKEISGKAAYQLYLDGILPELEKAGSRIVYFGESNDFLIGPSTEKWDAVLLMEHQSVLKFMELAQQPDFLKNTGHRMAAIADARLLPTTQLY